MNSTLDRRYVFLAAAVAVLILAGGAMLRPKKSVPEPPSPSEMASLQAKVRRNDLNETAAFFAERAEAFAGAISFDAENGSSAVAWRNRGEAVVAAREGELADAPLKIRPSTATPPPVRAVEPQAGGWLLVVVRTADDKVLWNPVIYNGQRQSVCSGVTYRELMVSASLDGSLAGAAAFDPDGFLAGVIARCDSGFHLVSVESISALLQAFDKPARKREALYGFRVETLDADALTIYSIETGLLVSEITRDDAADRAGLRAGDIVVGVSEEGMDEALGAGETSERTLDILRSRRRISIKMPGRAEAEKIRTARDALGIHILPDREKSEWVSVSPGTAAYRAGLRTGDRLLQIGEDRLPSFNDLTRSLAKAGDKPVLLVYERDNRQRAVLVAR